MFTKSCNRAELMYSKYHSGDLILDKEEIRRPISLTQQLVKLFHRIRLDVEHEALAAQAWMAWLKYGMFHFTWLFSPQD